jgi:hypothetical protein
MGKLVDLQANRSRLEHRRKDERAERLKQALRQAREPAPGQQESTQQLLSLFKRKPPVKPSGKPVKGR